MSRIPDVRVLALLALAFTSAPALAQQTSREFIEAGLLATGMSESDIANGLDIESQTYPADQGLVVDVGSVRPRNADPYSADNPSTVVFMLANPTAEPWCVRPKGGVRGATVKTSEVSAHNFVVEPGTSTRFGHAVVALSGGGYTYELYMGLAVWKPDYSQPFESQCRAAEPAYLHEWLADGADRTFADFAAEQEYNDMLEFEDPDGY